MPLLCMTVMPLLVIVAVSATKSETWPFALTVPSWRMICCSPVSHPEFIIFLVAKLTGMPRVAAMVAETFKKDCPNVSFNILFILFTSTLFDHVATPVTNAESTPGRSTVIECWLRAWLSRLAIKPELRALASIVASYWTVEVSLET